MDHKLPEEKHAHALDGTCQAILDTLKILIAGKNGRDVWARLEQIRKYVPGDWVTINTHVSHLGTAGRVVIDASKTNTCYNTLSKISRRISLPEYVD